MKTPRRNTQKVMRPGKTARDKASGAWANRLTNRALRGGKVKS